MGALWAALSRSRNLSRSFATLEGPQFYVAREWARAFKPYSKSDATKIKPTEPAKPGCHANPSDRKRFFCHASHFNETAEGRLKSIRHAQKIAVTLNASWPLYGQGSASAGPVDPLAPRCVQPQPSCRGRWQIFGVQAVDIAHAAKILLEEA